VPLTEKFSPTAVEAGWYEWWVEQQLFKAPFEGDAPSTPAAAAAAARGPDARRVPEQFVMMMPPPNVTGALHLGHALTAAIQDTLARYFGNLGTEPRNLSSSCILSLQTR